jgi:uncharacterized protein YdiU (UPF0061 family)
MIFAFGAPEYERLQIDVHGYERAHDSADRYDRNWLCVEVSVQAGSFRANEQIAILTWDLESFAKQLEEIYKKLTGTATFDTLENQIRFEIKGDGRGHMNLTGKLSNYARKENSLTFHLEFDQTQLKESIAELRRVVTAFPAR